MNYKEAVEFLYNQTPQFQRIGAAAYKPGLGTVRNLSAIFGNRHTEYQIIHVAGTNGKGSTSHTLAAVLQSAGYKVGLYTSPHLVDFRERMRVNGGKIPQEAVVDFLERYKAVAASVQGDAEPSFFELTTVMALEWFAKEKVDVAIIEVGLGGRLDSTNIITPVLSVITNISFDHMAQLGNTLESIAKEKAGIIKDGVGVVCGETRPEIKSIFADESSSHGSAIVFAQDKYESLTFTPEDSGFGFAIGGAPFGCLGFQLGGEYQKENACTIVAAIVELRKLGMRIPDDAVKKGFANVCSMTGLMGRWMKLSDYPLTVCDTGHNTGGWEVLSHQLGSLPSPLLMVIGFVNDKDISHILPLMPCDAEYVFTKASVPRALPAEELALEAGRFGLHGVVAGTVSEAYGLARERAVRTGGSIFVGGSTFVVADLLADCFSAQIS